MRPNPPHTIPLPHGRLATRDGMTSSKSSSSSQNFGYFHIWNKSSGRFRCTVPALPRQLSPKCWLLLFSGNRRRRFEFIIRKVYDRLRPLLKAANLNITCLSAVQG